LEQEMKKTLTLIVLAGVCLLAGFSQAPAAGAAVQSYTGCLSPILNAIYDVAPGDAPAHACVRPAAAIRLSSGDVTSLVAGTGLTGGGDNGDLSVSISPGYRLPQSCTNGQTPAWNGTAWGCASGASQADFNAFVALLGSAGTINSNSNPVHWTKLKGVPAGFADGTDDVGPSYAAGTGLSISGTTFSVDPAQVQNRISGTCPTGSSIRAIAEDGSVTCEGHTSYTAGDGLALTGSQFSVADGGITPAKLSFDPVMHDEFNAYSQLLLQAGTLNDPGNPLDWTKLKNVPSVIADPTLLQRRVSGDCAAGHAVRGVHADGSVDCEPVGSGAGGGDLTSSYCALAHERPHTFSDSPCQTQAEAVVASASYASLVLGRGGDPVVSFYDTDAATADGSVGGLWIARCVDPGCLGQSIKSHVTNWGAGTYGSVAIGTDGNPVVSYYDFHQPCQFCDPAADLIVAHCVDASCTGHTDTAVDTNGDVGQWTSLKIGDDGKPVIAYFDATNGALKVAHCDDAACAGGNETLSTVDYPGSIGSQISLVIGNDGNPVIAYYALPGALKVMHCDDPACAHGGETIHYVDTAGDVGQFASLAIGFDGNPVVSYYDSTNGDLKIAHCDDPDCASAARTTVDTGGNADVGRWTSLAIDFEGNPVVSYVDATNSDLELARCSDPACTASTVTRLDGLWSLSTSLAIGTDGKPVVAYKGRDGALKIARAGDSG
jgi:hypothetical protein